MSGFITLKRKSLDSWLWDMPAEQTKVALTLLLMANWKEGTTMSGGQLITIERGQVMTSLQALASKARVTVQTVRTTLRNLKRAGFLTSQSTNRFRIITITNYCREQAQHEGDQQADQQANQQAANKQLTSDQQATNNDRTREQGNNSLSSKKNSEVSAADLEAIYQLYPVKKGKKPGLAKAARTVTTATDLASLRKCVEAMSKAWAYADTQYCPHFSTFINQQLWQDDDWPMPKSATKPVARREPALMRKG